jgi:hypothetical protein
MLRLRVSLGVSDLTAHDLRDLVLHVGQTSFRFCLSDSSIVAVAGCGCLNSGTLFILCGLRSLRRMARHYILDCLLLLSWASWLIVCLYFIGVPLAPLVGSTLEIRLRITYDDLGTLVFVLVSRGLYKGYFNILLKKTMVERMQCYSLEYYEEGE